MLTSIQRGQERVTDILRPGSDPAPVMEKLLHEIQIPVSAIRAYRGEELLDETKVRMRGS